MRVLFYIEAVQWRYPFIPNPCYSLRNFCFSSLNFESKQQVFKSIFNFIQGFHIYGPCLFRNLPTVCIFVYPSHECMIGMYRKCRYTIKECCCCTTYEKCILCNVLALHNLLTSICLLLLSKQGMFNTLLLNLYSFHVIKHVHIYCVLQNKCKIYLLCTSNDTSSGPGGESLTEGLSLKLLI